MRFKHIHDISEILELELAYVNDKDDLGNSRLHVAMNGEIVEALINMGARVNAKNNLGKTPLHAATTENIVRKLIFFYADVDAKDNYGCTLLHYTKSKEITWALIENGADVNVKDNHGLTPLHTCHNSSIARILLQNDAGYIKNDNDQDPIEYHRYKLKKQFAPNGIILENLLEFERIISILSVISYKNEEETMVYLDLVVCSLLRENQRLTTLLEKKNKFKRFKWFF